MGNINYFCNKDTVEKNVFEQIIKYSTNEFIEQLCVFTDIHYCDEKAVPVGVSFLTKQYIYPLITGKDVGCGVMWLKISKENWLKPFDKNEHYKALNYAHTKMTNDGLGGGNHFLSIEEDENDVYIICHTGTRDRGIGLFQHCFSLVGDFSNEYGKKVEFIDKNYLKESFFDYYEQTLNFGFERRKNFCIKTLIFLQNSNYIKCEKNKIDKNYLNNDYSKIDNEGTIYGTKYVLSDSIHNLIRVDKEKNEIIHRKGSTELKIDNIVAIPLSMTRGTLFVKINSKAKANEALFSCAHGAGRQFSRFDTMKYWKNTLKEKERRNYKEQFSEMLDKSGNFPSGYIQEFDFAYKDHSEIFTYQPYLKKITQTKPIVTVKYTEI